MGAVTAYGVGVGSLWGGISTGRSAVTKVPDDLDNPCRAAAPVVVSEYEGMLDRIERRRLLPFTQFALIAAREAWASAAVSGRSITADERVAVIVGTGSGGFANGPDIVGPWLARGVRGVDRLTLIKTLPDAAACHISMDLGIRGPILTCSASCSSATQALGSGLDLIRSGRADAVLAIGTEAWLTPFAIANFSAVNALSRRKCPPEQASCPFDKRRDGFVPGEGAGALVLESLDGALARSAPILCELAGFASSGDAYNQMAPRPDGSSAARCIELALTDAGLAPVSVDYISAHGTSTLLNDRVETKALKIALGSHARSVAVSSVKSMMGHTLGASGAIESVATIKAMTEGYVPPTINLEESDPECDLDYVPLVARRATIGVALKTSFAFGGQNACLVFRKFLG
jgi:3-oxoacyl-[acyl-carrier-protein] synthase II